MNCADGERNVQSRSLVCRSRSRNAQPARDSARPDLFGPADAFERQVTQLIERIKATPRQPGVEDIRIPSERAFRSRERALRAGLEIDRVVFDALIALRTR
jgi:LDH2 family malate/lactate/ureidoglycolate dehydrogenase